MNNNTEHNNALDWIATQMDRNDEKPNIDLAKQIIKTKRTDWVKQLVEGLRQEDKNIQSDCIKTLYEIGEHGAPKLIVAYVEDFIKLLNSKNNRLVWGAMTALDTIAEVGPKSVYAHLSQIMTAIDKGSVITIDHGVGILAKLSVLQECAKTTFPLLLEQLRSCPAKQLPMYAEKSLIAINSDNVDEFNRILQSRTIELEKDSQKRRIEKVLKSSINK